MIKLINEIVKSGGATLYPQNLKKIKVDASIWCVSLHGYEKKTRNKNELKRLLKEYQKKCLSLNDEGLFVGVWYNDIDSYYYIDITKLIENKREAIQEGKKNEQKAIYNLYTGEELKLDYYIKYYNIYKLKNNKDLRIIKQYDTIEEVSRYFNKQADYIRKCIENDILLYNNYIVKCDKIHIQEI